MSNRWLLDTRALCGHVRASPSVNVSNWLAAADEEGLAPSLLTLAELRRGTLALPPSKRRAAPASSVDEALPARFLGRLSSVDKTVADVGAERQARLDRKGRPWPVFDGLIAATALAHGYGAATRNERDFAALVVPIVNPWLP